MVANCAEHLQRRHHGARLGNPRSNGLACGLWSENDLVKAAARQLLGVLVGRFTAAFEGSICKLFSTSNGFQVVPQGVQSNHHPHKFICPLIGAHPCLLRASMPSFRGRTSTHEVMNEH